MQVNCASTTDKLKNIIEFKMLLEVKKNRIDVDYKLGVLYLRCESHKGYIAK